jgi:DNA polymerase
MNKVAKHKEFLKLAGKAQKCRICKAMQDKTAVLSELNGSLNPKVFFIAEAPGRQGADRTRKPFSGDKSGANFQILLDSIGLKREEIFITNAVLCSPRSETGANRRPFRSEIIATIGGVSLEALKAIENHEFTLKSDVAKILDWNGRILIPLYHPSPQVVITVRKLEQQIEDFRVLWQVIGRAQTLLSAKL